MISVLNTKSIVSSQRAGNVFVAFNNRNATDVIPLMAPLIAPSARLLGPILNQIAASPVRSTVEVNCLIGVLGLHAFSSGSDSRHG